MLQKLIRNYYKLLDEKLENWTLVVVLIAFLIISVSLITKDTNAIFYAKNNVLEISSGINNANSIIEINWIQYKIILEKN